MFIKNICDFIVKKTEQFVFFLVRNTDSIVFYYVIYMNFISKIIFLRNIINIFYFYYLYNNHYYYDYNYIINKLIEVKLYFLYFFSWNKKDIFILQKAFIYENLKDYYDVTDYFIHNKINLLDNYLLTCLFMHKKIFCNLHNDMRLKIFFSYNGVEYILYHMYNFNNIPYPPYGKDIIDKYRNSIVCPHYPKKKNGLYSLFSISSKDIDYVKINGVIDENIKKYIKSIQTPFYDFGLLYIMPVKLRWLIEENGLNNFNDIEISFLNLYFDEENMDLKKHEIKMNKEDVDKIIESQIMKSFLE
jgi:hypothetical protein